MDQLQQMVADPVVRVIGAMILMVMVLGTYVTTRIKRR